MSLKETQLQIQIAKAAAITQAAAIMYHEMDDEAYDVAKEFADKAFKKIEGEWGK